MIKRCNLLSADATNATRFTLVFEVMLRSLVNELLKTWGDAVELLHANQVSTSEFKKCAKKATEKVSGKNTFSK